MGSARRSTLLAAALLPILACHTPIDFEVEPAMRIGAVSGSFQIPAGGKASSTSPRRPTLTEMGVENTWQPGLAARARGGPHDVTVEARYLFLRGSGEADGDLTSQEETFPDGTGLTSDSGIATWGLGYGYRVSPGEEWTITPRALVAGISARYRITGDNGATTDRSISHFAPGLGAEIVFRPEGTAARFSLRAGGTGVWRGRTVQVVDVALRAGTDLAEGVEGWVELGVQKILLEDDQDVPNRVDVTLLPALGIGLTLRF